MRGERETEVRNDGREGKRGRIGEKRKKVYGRMRETKRRKMLFT